MDKKANDKIVDLPTRGVEEELAKVPGMQVFVTMKSRKSQGVKILTANGAFLGTEDLTDIPPGLVKELKEHCLFVADVSEIVDSLMHSLAFSAKTSIHLKQATMYKQIHEYITERIEGIDEYCRRVIEEAGDSGIQPEPIDDEDLPIGDDDTEVTH